MRKCVCVFAVQEEDYVPEDRGSVQDLRELERLDQVHDAGDHTQGDCHVRSCTQTHMQTNAHTQTDMHAHIVQSTKTYKRSSDPLFCFISPGRWWWQRVTCLPSLNPGRSRARYTVMRGWGGWIRCVCRVWVSVYASVCLCLCECVCIYVCVRVCLSVLSHLSRFFHFIRTLECFPQ